MKKKNFIMRGTKLHLGALMMGALLFASCADTYDGKDTFSGGVTNTTLDSPDESGIEITPSTDGTQQTITWPVVFGAGGYEVSLYDVNDPNAPVVIEGIENKVIDGCSLTSSRPEDTNFKLTVRTLGNEKLNNKEAVTSTEKNFSSFIASIAQIPEGDLYSYFQSNQIPDASDMLYYDLIPGGNYTLSDAVDFLSHKVTLRTTSKNNHAKITYTGNSACLQSGTSFGVKYVDFDCAASTTAPFQMSKTLDESIMGLVSGTQNYYDIVDPILIMGCNFENVNGKFMYDNGQKYGIGSLDIKDCVVHLTTNTASTIVFDFRGGGVVSLSVQNSTFYNTGDQDHSYFVQYGNNARATRMGYTENLISYQNSTFYNIAKAGQWGNYSGFNGQSCSYWVMTNCIFVDCSNNAVARRFVGGAINSSHPTFANNTYMFDGAFEENSSYDQSGTQITEDPKFANPANGDFTVNGAAQIQKRTGDPRWLPAND